MRRRTMKVSRILLYYSLAVTTLLIAFFIVYVGTISAPQASLPKYLLTVNEKNIIYFIQSGNSGLPVNDIFSSVISKNSLENYYISAMLKNMPLFAACLAGMLVLGTFILSRILKRQDEKQALYLAKQLSSLDNGENLKDQHPAVVEAYHEIRERLETNALDYVRLGSYVTHEQKNILSLLRAKLQLSGNVDLTREVDRVTDSLDDILTLSASRESKKYEAVDVALVCADVCDDYRKVHPGIVFDFDDDANNMVSAREMWVKRAVSNLVSNAVKYGGSGEISVSVTNRKGSVIISVCDEGDGIPEAEQEKLFDYRYRVGNLNSDGYGIGLSLVRHVCDLCGGMCWIENRMPRGVTFSMILPEALTQD